MLKPNQNNPENEEVSLTEHTLQPRPVEANEAQPLTTVTEGAEGSSKDSKAASVEAEPVDPRLSEAGKKFVELLTERLFDQGYPAEGDTTPKVPAKGSPRKNSVKSKQAKGVQKQPSTVHRTMEMADKFMRIVEDRCGKMPLTLPPESPVFGDRRIIGMLVSRDFLPDVSLSNSERARIVKKHVPELYETFRKRYFSDYLGKPMNQEKGTQAEANAQASTQNSVATAVVANAESTLADLDGPTVGQALRESTAGADSLQRGAESEGFKPDRESDVHVTPATAQPMVDSVRDELSETEGPVVEEEEVEKKKEDRNPGVVVKLFSAQLLVTRLIDVHFPPIFETFLDTRPDLVTILDLLNMPRRELLSVPNFKEKRMSEVQDTLSHLHPGVGILFASVSSFPLSAEVVDQLSKSFVAPSIFIDGKLAQNLQGYKLPIDNGLRLLYMTPEIMKTTSITPQMHGAIAERFFKVGFGR